MSDNSRSFDDREERLLAGWLGDGPHSADEETDMTLLTLDELWVFGPAQEALEGMQTGLDEWWARQSPLVYYDWLPSTIGRVYVVASDEGVTSVEFGFEDDGAFQAHFAERHSGGKVVRFEHSAQRLENVIEQLGEYFSGKREQFDFPLDLSNLTEFQREVLEATSQVPQGEIVTYKEIARRIGKPTASRAVGNALGRNPVPILIPCHRVLPIDGSLGGYSGAGGPGTKARLLELEGVLPGGKGLYYAASA